MELILSFDHPDALQQALTGGKGVNLSRLSQAGFPVPPGFTISSAAYSEFLGQADLSARLMEHVAQIDYDDPVALERQTAEIRELIMAVSMPAELAAQIEQGYAGLGVGTFVAVRSSGTAEDLADASFAGQHDTYLDVRGTDQVTAAVQRCWASLWTARAVSYRQQGGFDHAAVKIAVVVQKMVSSEVSGVMFTANPLTSATDEIVINATLGLGEALVQGTVTPDQYVVQARTFLPIEQQLGEKELRIVRDQAAGSGVVSEEVAEHERERFSLDLPDVTKLARLGARVQDYYGGFPQDIEWAIESGEVYLLQSRPITGVEFSWDADVEDAQRQGVAHDAVWTRTYADSIMTGAVCPLQYSARAPQFSWRHLRRMFEVFGLKELAGMRNFKYWKGEWYFNVEIETLFIEKLVPPAVRQMFLDFVPPTMHEQTLTAPFDQAVFARAMMRWHLLDPATTPGQFLKTFEEWRRRTDYEGLSKDELRALDDEQLIAYCQEMMELEGEWGDAIFTPFMVTLRLAVAGLAWMVATWYDAGDAMATFAKLVAGSTRRTDTQIENSDLLALVGAIRRSAVLRQALEDHQDGDFFDHLRTFDDGRCFMADYDAFIAKWGHRGHADRDLIYPRRADDPSIDYRAFKLLLATDEVFDPEANEREISQQREQTLAEVLANVATKPDGPLKVELLKVTYFLAHEYLMIRDNERGRPTDVLMYSYKRGFDEVGRRLLERGMIEDPRDHNCLSELELYQYLRGQVENEELLRVKIAARRRDVVRMLRKEIEAPKYLVRNRPVDLDHPPVEGEEGVFPGTATSPGVTTGAARVVMDHTEMGRVSKGEILVTHSTDPGWNPVFTIISAVVVETGGMLSHASCLARELGFPAVHLPRATKLIEDGVTITVNGDTGMVTVEGVVVTRDEEEPQPVGAV
jgi:rifampicin phosphotransferase